MINRRFTLPEETLLLVWDDQRGRRSHLHHLSNLLAGAAISAASVAANSST